MRLFDHAFAHHGPTAPPWPQTRHIAHGGESVDVEDVDNVSLILNLTGEHRVSGWLDGRFHCQTPLVNSVTVMPAGSHFAFSIEGHCRILAVTIPLPFELGRAGTERIQPRLNAIDPELAGYIWRTATASAEGRNDAQAVLSGHLFRKSARRTQPTGGIAPRRLRRVLDQIEANVSSSHSLMDLASVAGLSRFHFARAFALSTGTSPHRYVMSRRVAHAISALNTDQSVDDVALVCGFANASHLGQHIRRTTGITPRQVSQFARSVRVAS